MQLGYSHANGAQTHTHTHTHTQVCINIFMREEYPISSLSQ